MDPREAHQRENANAATAAAATMTATDDRRIEQRVQHRAAIMMAFGPGLHGGFEQVTMLNCATRGVGVLVPAPLPVNSRFFLKLRLSSVALAIYTVRHCSPVEGGYEVGAHFAGVIGTDRDSDATAEEVLAALLASDPLPHA